MEIAIIVVLIGIVALYVSLYRRALSESAGLTSLQVLMLLDDKAYKVQRQELIDFVTNTPAKDAKELSTKVHLSFCRFAGVAKGPAVFRAHEFLWKLKNGAITEKQK